MSNKKVVHYNLDAIDREGANINLIWGEKANGKSYQVKHKKAILPYLQDTTRYTSSYKNPKEVIEEVVKAGNKFILMRRFREEIKTGFIEQYFMDVDVVSLTDGRYNCITMYRGRIYLSYYDTETTKLKRGEHIGYAVSLSTEQNYAGGSFLDVTDIIFEEFMSRTAYLADESNKLMTFYSTIDRRRGIVKLWLVGNTVTRVCPYIQDWNLTNIMFNLKQGEIKSMWIPTGEVDEDGIDIKVKLAIEHCGSVKGSNFVIGTHADSTNKGKWQTDPQPKLSKNVNEFKKLFEIGFFYKGFKFKGCYMMDNDTKDVIWFIYPFTKEFKNNIIVFSDVIKPSIYYQRDIYSPSLKNDNIKKILQTFRENRIFYASDLCGTEFKQAIDFEIRK